MDFDNEVLMLEEVSPDQIEVEVETSETYLLDPLTDHNYVLTEPRKSPHLPHNVRIRELKALYHCGKCGYATLNKYAMDTHSLTHKPKEKPKPPPLSGHYIPCPSCNVKHTETYEKCTKCSYFTKKKTSLKIHMRIHMEANPYKCTECKHRVENLKELIRHYEDAHRTFEKFRCHICHFSTHSRSALATHHQTHGEALLCEICSYRTLHKSEMTRHMKTHYSKLNK